MKLNLPPFSCRVRNTGDAEEIFDPIRRKWVHLTPEERVRQQFVAWLISGLHYPTGLIANEVGISLNSTRRRCDTIIYRRDGRPLMIVEYKAPEVMVTQDVFDQIVRYNMVLHADYLVVTNGLNHYCCKIDYKTGNFQFLPQIPEYNSIATDFSVN